jgi:hypothetical protein
VGAPDCTVRFSGFFETIQGRLINEPLVDYGFRATPP